MSRCYAYIVAYISRLEIGNVVLRPARLEVGHYDTPIENIIGVGGFVLAHVIYEWLPHLVLHKEYISDGAFSNYYQCQLIFH